MSGVIRLVSRQLRYGRPRHCACYATANGDGGGDENKAFRFNNNNRRQPVQAGKGASKNLIKAMSELSKGRATPNQGTKTVFGADQMTWKQVDEAVNEYPCQRVFTAIGVDSDDFQAAMVACVEQVLCCKVHEEAVVVRPSSGGKYLSVKIGPVIVTQPDEVLEVYALMKADSRLKWFI